MRGRDVVRAPRRAGFEVVRVHGSDHYLGHPDGRHTVVPVHAGEEIGPDLMRGILNHCDMTIEQFLSL